MAIPSTTITSTRCSAARFVVVTFIALLVGAGPLAPVPAASAQPPGASPGTITFSGQGWGHGVGMSQYGAFGRAANGAGYPAILRFYYRGIALPQTQFTAKLTVHVATVSSATMIPEGNVTLRINSTTKGTAKSGDTVVVAHSAAGWSIRVNGTQLCQPGRCAGGVFSMIYAAGTPVKLVNTGLRYNRGRIRLVPTAANPAQLYATISHLALDDYVYGLAEVPASWPAEVLKAQAVAGRTYAQNRTVARRASAGWNLPFDLYSGTNDQAYNGMNQSRGPFGAAWVAAVNATSGVIGTYNGSPIEMVYSSSNGGHSENSGYVWFATLPYLRANPDPFDKHRNPNATWTRTYTVAQVSQWLAAKPASNVGTLTDIAINAPFGASSRVDKANVVLTGTTGTKTISGNALRSAINNGAGGGLANQILSTKFRVTGLGSVDDPPRGRFVFSNVVNRGPGAHVDVSGWAIDPDTAAPRRVLMSDNGTLVGGRVADDPVSWISRTFGLGPNHGYEIRLPLTPGEHVICLRVRNHPDNRPVQTQCRRVFVAP